MIECAATCLLVHNRGEEHEHLEAVMAFFERRSSRKLVRYWRARRTRLRKLEVEEAKRQRAAAKEKARQEALLRVVVDQEDKNSDAAAISPIRTEQLDEEIEILSDEEVLEIEEGEEESREVSEDQPSVGQPSPSHAGVGANLT